MASNRKRVTVVIGALDRLSGPLKKMSGRIEKIKAPVDKVNRAVNKLGREAGLREFNRGLRQANRNARRAAQSLAGAAKWAGGLAAVGVGAGFGLAKSFATSGDEIAKTADRIGFGVEALQEYRYAADRSGVSAATFDMAMQRFGRRSAEAAKGMGEAKGALKALGVQLKGSDGNLRSAEALFTDVANALGKVQDPLTRNALAMKLFDSEGVKLVQMMKDGSAGIEDLRKEAKRLGLVMSEDAARSSEAFVDKMTNVQAVLTGLRNRLGGALLPALSAVAVHFTELGIKLGPKLSVWAENFAKTLPERIERLQTGFAEVMATLAPLADAIGWISENFGLLNTAITAVMAIAGFKAVAAIVSLAAAFKALGVSIALTPIGWIIGGIAAVVAGGVLLYKNWDKITGAFARFSAVAKGAIGSAWSAVSGFGKRVAGTMLAAGKRVRDAIVGIAVTVAKYSPFGMMIRGIDSVIERFSGFSVLDRIREKIQNLLPAWALDMLGYDASAAPSAPVSAPIPSGGKAEVGGKMVVEIQDHRTRVQQVTSNNSNVPIEVDAGFIMGGA